MINNVKGYTIFRPIAYTEIKPGTIVVEIRFLKKGSVFIRGRNTSNSEYYFLAIPNTSANKGIIGGYTLMDTPKIHWTEVEGNTDFFVEFEIVFGS